MEYINVAPLKENVKDYSLLVKHNNLVQGKYSLEASEQKLLYKIFEEIQKKCYTTREVELRFKDFYTQYKGVLGKNITKKELKSLLESLQGKFVYIIKGDEYIRTQWYKILGKLDLSSVKLIIDEDVFEYVQSLDKNFTGLRIDSIYSFKSFYSMRIYELLKQWSETKELLCVEENKGYDNFTNFNKYVLEKAITEINEKSELTVEIERLKKGRVIEGIRFNIIQDLSKKNELPLDVPGSNISVSSDVQESLEVPNIHSSSSLDESSTGSKSINASSSVENFYIPEELRMDDRLKRVFSHEFNQFDFNDTDYFILLLEAEDCTLTKDKASSINIRNYKLFKNILDTKIKDFCYKQEQKMNEIQNDYEDLSLEERQLLFQSRVGGDYTI